MGIPTRTAARQWKMGPNTAKGYRRSLAAAGLLDGPVEVLPSFEQLQAAVSTCLPPPCTAQQVSSIEAWREPIVALVGKGVGPRAIYDRLRSEHAGSFPGSYWAVKRFCRALGRERGVSPHDVAIPVDTDPGEIAQVDFGYVGKLFDPETRSLRKAWCFVMVLGFSRHLLVRIVFDQRIETWIQVHIEVFTELRGVLKTVVPDNLKAAVIRAAFSVDGETALNRSYRELARHYGFLIDPAPPRDPAKKGKVEAGVKYVKRNFFAGRQGQDVSVVRVELGKWLEQIAGTRIHGTTGKQPRVVFETEEQGALLPLPARAFEPATWKQVTIRRDCMAPFDGRFYSVPWTLVDQKLWLRATPSSVVLFADEERVATHERGGPALRSVKDEHLPEHRGELRHRRRDYGEQRAETMGPEVGAFVREVFDSDPVQSSLRCVQAIVLHLETVTPERARAACLRARFFGSYTHASIKNILARGLDLEVLPAVVVPSGEAANDTPRFARPASTWSSRQEVRDESGR